MGPSFRWKGISLNCGNGDHPESLRPPLDPGYRSKLEKLEPLLGLLPDPGYLGISCSLLEHDWEKGSYFSDLNPIDHNRDWADDRFGIPEGIKSHR
ncbi:hypothetical protein O181_036476 [Austropuccinia psidii MF-1]|uniref:Uncharacterized protein n=1 Tax=Austropuccinia psidii MF-1 TaxID=1389203 RepID=A0A9Q3DA97_9BASI|nr:hypothetical protein [Austropuccinia psidii MF-1]